MEELATYYVTLKPIRKGGKEASGMKNIAFVDDPAIEEIGIYLNKQDSRIVADEKIQKHILEYLESVGCVKPDHWKEVTEEEYLNAKNVNLTTDPTSRDSYNDYPDPNGGGQWLVRYKYDGPQDFKNRSFCAQILAFDRLYTEEEIKNGLSNPEFGNYSIFDYKGSYGCRHRWKRSIFYEDFEDDEVRKVGNVPSVVSKLGDKDATTLNAFLSKDEKMQVCAPLLIPDKDVYRNDELGKYNMRFTADTISELRDISNKNNVLKKQDLFKDTHEGGTAPSHIIDEWIVEGDDDKAYTEYGFDKSRIPQGTWMVLSQVTDRDFWENEIKGNKKHAYSIEALINLTIIKMSKMENEKIVLPDGEHLIGGKIYVVESGEVIATKEVTPEQEAEVKEVAEEAASNSNPEELEKEEKKPEEMEEKKEEDKPKEEMSKEEEKPEQMEEKKEAPANDSAESTDVDRLSRLEKQQEELLEQIAKMKAEMEQPKEEEVEVDMSDNRPMWKRISDGINAINKSK